MSSADNFSNKEKKIIGDAFDSLDRDVGLNKINKESDFKDLLFKLDEVEKKNEASRDTYKTSSVWVSKLLDKVKFSWPGPYQFASLGIVFSLGVSTDYILENTGFTGVSQEMYVKKNDLNIANLELADQLDRLELNEDKTYLRSPSVDEKAHENFLSSKSSETIKRLLDGSQYHQTLWRTIFEVFYCCFLLFEKAFGLAYRNQNW